MLMLCLFFKFQSLVISISREQFHPIYTRQSLPDRLDTYSTYLYLFIVYHTIYIQNFCFRMQETRSIAFFKNLLFTLRVTNVLFS